MPKENNRKTDENTNEHSNDAADLMTHRGLINYKLKFYDDMETPENRNKIIFLDSYSCLTAIFWAINEISYGYKGDSLSSDPMNAFETCEYLSLIGQRILDGMSDLIQKEYFLKGGQNNEQ